MILPGNLFWWTNTTVTILALYHFLGFLSFVGFFCKWGGNLNFEGTASFLKYLLLSALEWGKDVGYEKSESQKSSPQR